MSKKQDFLRREQSRSKNPGHAMKGSATVPAARSQAKGQPEDHVGKVAGEHNKASPEPTQTHESQRTPESRNDRESHLGSGNQAQTRRGGPVSGQR